LDPESDEVKAANAEFRAFKDALTRHHRIAQKNMVRLTCISLEYVYRFTSSSSFSHTQLLHAGLAIPTMFCNAKT
jgi:hypothetical protein